MSDLTEIFMTYKDSPIALYGLGTETERILLEWNDNYNIVGLLDSFREDGILYGKPIISLKKCLKYHVKIIIVVARPGSCKAIARQISDFCLENQIALVDVRGKNLCAPDKASYNFQGINGITREQLLSQVMKNDVVSIDLFDTLIMRRVPGMADVIELTDNKLRKKKIFIEGFCQKRLQGEKELARHAAPTLEDIYQFVLDRSEPVDVTAKELAELEWTVDSNLLVQRQEMVEFLRQTYKFKKEIYIVTDSYYRKPQIEEILKKFGIDTYRDILVSCECGMSKTQGLFRELKGIIGGQSCLHIGDDLVADIESAEQQEIASCQIYNGVDLLEKLGYLGLWKDLDKLSSRLKVGMFIAKAFNSPFQFEEKDKMLHIKTAYEIGYLFMAPMITDFVVWFDWQVKAKKLNNVWFSARDGFLIKKLYDILNEINSSIYFQTSRMAAVRAGMEDKSDITYVASMKFSGTLRQQLQQRFGIFVMEEETEGKSLADFTQIIMEQAQINRRNYRTYLVNLQLEEGDIAFFDFVAKGTSQMYVGRLTDRHLAGLYFLQLEKEYMQDKNLDITAFYERGEEEDSAIYENYYILETALTSEMPSVAGFDENGKVIYDRETRTHQDIECFQKMQDGIIDYFTNYVQLCADLDKSVDKSVDETLLGLIHKLKIDDADFMKLKVEDTFFNRMTDMVDLI